MNCMDFCLVVAVPSFVAESPGTSSMEQLVNTEGVPRPSGLYHSQETQDKARETPLHSEWTKILWPETITRNLIKARATPQHRG